jgi:hypothetical protein
MLLLEETTCHSGRDAHTQLPKHLPHLPHCTKLHPCSCSTAMRSHLQRPEHVLELVTLEAQQAAGHSGHHVGGTPGVGQQSTLACRLGGRGRQGSCHRRVQAAWLT